jgi:hypothetical protein
LYNKNYLILENQTAFRLVSKNSPPEIVCRRKFPQPPYQKVDVEATHYKCSSPLKVDTTLAKLTDPNILRKGGDFSLSTCSNASSGDKELERPFFYQDNQHSFFVKPELLEPPITKVDNYGIAISLHGPELYEADKSRDIPLVAQVSNLRKDSGIDPIDERSHFKIQQREDWVTDPATVLQFGEHLVGQTGKIDLEILPTASDIGESGKPATIGHIGFLALGGVLKAKGDLGTSSGGISPPGRDLNVIDSGGLKDTMLSNIVKSRGSELVRSTTGIR